MGRTQGERRGPACATLTEPGCRRAKRTRRGAGLGMGRTRSSAGRRRTTVFKLAEEPILLGNGRIPHHLDLQSDRYGETVVVRLTGELDIACEEHFEQSLRVLEQHADGIVLDLSALSFMDSTGIRLVLQAWYSTQRGGCEFAIVLGDSPVKRTLEIAGLDRVLPIATDARH